MNILIITPDYPDKDRSVYTFVKQVVDQFAVQGNHCCVIAPYSITKNHAFYKREIEKYNVEGNIITVLRPNHFTLSNFSLFGFTPSLFLRERAIKRVLNKIPFIPDIIYAHFWRSGKEIFQYAKNNTIPLFIATGESVIPKSDVSPLYNEFYNYVSGVICVSTKNLDESVANGMTIKEKCIVLPNAINNKTFYLRDKIQCRKILNLPLDVFIVAFCGAFIHRKGVRVLSEALDRITDKPVYSLFLGRSIEEEPVCRNILYKGQVHHNDLPIYLNAADIFVLPTLSEGCCNAIIEAMACGLPIVSSNKPFNWDILNLDNSILIDPKDSVQVADAITHLRDDAVDRSRLSLGALKTAESLTIDKRTSKILNFVQKRLDSN